METPLRVLIVGDSEEEALLLLQVLKEGGYAPDYKRVSDSDAMRQAFQQHWDLAISDYFMRRFSGPDALRLLNQLDPDIPFILLSAGIGEQAAVEVMRMGARDCLMKAHLDRLSPVVDRELKEARERIRKKRIAEQSLDERRQLNVRLQQAQKMEAIGQLTGGIAHDFNNILSSILGFTSLALQRFVRDDQPELRDYLNEVYHAGERARDLVSQLLAFSRTGNSKASQMKLSPMINEVTRLLKSTLPSSIQLSSQIDTDTPSVMMDTVQLQQVLMHICINARDAIGDKGSITIRLRYVNDICTDRKGLQQTSGSTGSAVICAACHSEIEAGSYVELSVQDSGSGINHEQLGRIFEPFFTTKEVGKGTGMGLSMVHGIIHQYKGHILVDTAPGNGSVFRLFLPVVTGQPDHQHMLEPDTGQIKVGLKGVHILIIDDEESVARFMGDLFESQGCITTVMTDSQAAYEHLSGNSDAYQLVITDQTMPGLTGVELAEKIMMLAPDLPIILCTGYSEQVDERRAREMGISGYISKPMEIHSLLDLAAELIHG